MVRKFEKRSSSSHGEEPNNCALAHCRCNNAAENFDRPVTKTLSQNYSRQDLFQDSLALKTLAFRAVCVELIVGQIQSQGQKLSYRQIHFQNLRGHPDGFSWLVKNRAYFGSVQNTQLLEECFARTELLALAVVDSPVLVGQKRERDKTRVVLY